MSVLTCPVCSGPMREIERNGVHIDTCTKCRGVWLDRGELAKIATMMTTPAPPAEQAFLAGARPLPAAAPYPPQAQHRRRDDDDDDDDWDERRYYGDRGHGSKPHKQSKMKRLLDFFD